jgi:hypothetical protein
MSPIWRRTVCVSIVILQFVLVLLVDNNIIYASGEDVDVDVDGSTNNNSTNTTTLDSDTISNVTGYTNLVHWLRENGGRVDSRLGLELNRDGIRGAVALEDIPAGTELLFCPWNMVLGTQEGNSTELLEGGHCAVLEAYAKEVRKGKHSFWYPYLVMDDSLNLNARIPTVWHASALAELQDFPPHQALLDSSLTAWFTESCAHVQVNVNGNDNGTLHNIPSFDQLHESHRQALQAAITRAAGMRFLPFYDLFNHDNGQLNTASLGDIRGDSIVTTVDVSKGSELFVSYRGGRSTSSDMFSRYGFLEGYPQQWTSWTTTTNIAADDTDDAVPPSPLPHQEERFMILSESVVILNPPDSLTTDVIGTVPQPIHNNNNLLTSAERHNAKLSRVELERFIHTFGSLVASTTTSTSQLRSTTTTVEEDAQMIITLEQKLLLLGSHNSDDVNDNNVNDDDVQIVKDRLRAVMYRKSFKEAIQQALAVAERLLHAITTDTTAARPRMDHGGEEPQEEL